jgi:hypothetical protein
MSRYSQLYIERVRLQPDSERARVRLHGLFEKMVTGREGGLIARRLKAELGVEVIKVGLTKYHFKAFFLKAALRDVLDTVTEVAKFFQDFDSERSSYWLSQANRIFEEENLAYRVGTNGIVHPFVDAEFEVNQASAIEALSQSRFDEARSGFEASFRHLRDGNGREALRMMFPAVETAAKVLFPGAFARLMPNEVDRHIVPRMQARYAGNQPAIDAGNQLLGGMKSWINAAQLYRHGQEQQERVEPPMDFVIAHLSAGATYLRWMIELCVDE